jgi:hypothetical protein
MENAGKMLFRLRKNYRARVKAVEWAQSMFYGESMDVVHCRHNQASKNFINWVIKTFAGYKTYSSTLLIRPPNCNESMFGTSFSNEGNAHFAVQLVIQLYRDANVLDARDLSRRGSVLIITPYSVQKNYYDLLLNDVTEAEIPKALVEVRTVDDSPSHEADIVIVDWVRTNKKGFIDNPQRMCVALSRARIGTIMIGPGDKVPLVWPLNHLVEYCKDRHAAIDLKHRCHWDLMCPHCCQPGHMAKDCTFQPTCARCNGAQHATRNCPRNAEDAISVSAAEPITANDGIERDAMNPPVKISNSKRAKVNKEAREGRFAKPQTQKAARVKGFRDAIKKSRKEDDDVAVEIETEADKPAEDDEDAEVWYSANENNSGDD